MPRFKKYSVDASTCFRDTVPVINCKSDSRESENLLLKNELCSLKMCFEIVSNENKALQYKLRDIVCLKYDE